MWDMCIHAHTHTYTSAHSHTGHSGNRRVQRDPSSSYSRNCFFLILSTSPPPSVFSSHKNEVPVLPREWEHPTRQEWPANPPQGNSLKATMPAPKFLSSSVPEAAQASTQPALHLSQKVFSKTQIGCHPVLAFETFERVPRASLVIC